MANISKIKLPNGTTYNVTDSGALPLTGGTVTGPVTFNGGVELNYFTSQRQSGSGFYIINQGWNDEQGIFIGYHDSGTSYGLEILEIDSVGHVGLSGLRDPGSPTDAANKRYVDAVIPDISGKADKSATVSTITYDSTNKKLTKTINGTTTDVVTVATLKTALGSMPASDVYSWAKASSKPSYTYSEITGTVPSSALPSYVDDVLEYTAKANFPTTGETGKIYVDTATNITYRWGGSNYIEISPSLALGTTSSTAFRGDYGNAAYTHATDASRLTTAKTSGLYKIAVTAHGHVQSVTAVAKADITGLGIPAQDTTYSSKAAASGGTDVSLVTTGEKYTWNNKIGASNPTIATDTGTSSVTLAHGGKYKLTAGGGSIVFTMPSDANTWRGIQDNLTSSTNTTESLSAKQGYLLANGSARDSTKLPLAGGTMTGALNTVNNTWNKIGDDVQIGDINEAGTLGIQGINGATAIRFTTYNQTTKTTGGKISWDGTKFIITGTVDTSISGNAATATKATYDANNLRIDTGYLKLTGGSVTGPVSFGDSVTIDDLTIGQAVVDGTLSVANNLQVNTINGVTVGTSPKFTDHTYIITLNGTATSSPSFYAPTSAGTSGYYLKSNGSGAPTWGAITYSTSAPTSSTAGNNGDIWFVYS